MKYLTLSLLFLLLSCLQVQALKTTISGSAKGNAGKTIYLWIYNDYITFTETEIASSKISAEGLFELSFDATDTQYGFLSVENEFADLYITGGHSYKISFPELAKTSNKNAPFFERNFRKLKFQEADSTSLNLMIVRFNRDYDDFLSKNYQYFHGKAISGKIKEFETLSNTKYNAEKSPFFKRYITYSVAGAEQTTSVKREALFNKYILGKPVLLRHLEYMNFFAQFYEKKLDMFVLTEKGKMIAKAINEKTDFKLVLEVLANDKELANDTICQAVLVKDLQNLYHNPTFKKAKILLLLENISRESKIKEIQKAASNLRSRLMHLAPGTPAPDFELTDLTGKKVKLSDFKGKYVYLEFTSAGCALCLAETKIIPSLKKKYEHKVEFISIFIGDETAQINKFLPQLNSEWTFLRATKNHPIVTAYSLKAIPAYFLIAPDQKLFESPARKPSEGIERAFTEILKRK